MDREFKQGMADLIYKLSQAIDPECRPMSKDRLTTMVELISEQIDNNNKLSKSLKPYERIINRIIAGEIKIYNLSVTNLMQAFQTQSEFIYYHD
jgi:hypothetical protein